MSWMVNGHPCQGCLHWRGANEATCCCNYYLDTGVRRPCQFGEGCTVKTIRRRWGRFKEKPLDK